MKRPPFKMTPSRHAVLTCDGRFITGGRASFVWETFLQRRASGIPGEHAIRDGRHNAPWHRIEMTIEEAEAALAGWGIFGNRRVVRARRLREARRARGLPVN